MKKALHDIKNTLSNNQKVVENYFFMTILQIINSVFGILIYPFVIRKLGPGSYGIYVFAVSVATYFIGFISFGFSFPALQAIVANKNDIHKRSEVVSAIFSAKLYLSIVSTLIFCTLLYTVPIIRQHKVLFILCFTQIFGELLFPTWYFQGMQKMKIVTYIQLLFKVISLPFIFIYIHTPSDTCLYAIITSLTINLGGISATLLLVYSEKIKLKIIPPRYLKGYLKDAIPFFWSSVTGIIKQESATIIIGTFLGMRDVALYDLANKIIVIPRLLTTSINGALFPKIAANNNKESIRKIIKYETYIGITISLLIITFGYWAILLLGGDKMYSAYPLAVILSITIWVWLVVGSYISFIFVPQNKYYYVSSNQLVALIVFFVLCIPGILLYPNALTVVSSLTISGIAEVVYCKYLIKKNKLYDSRRLHISSRLQCIKIH